MNMDETRHIPVPDDEQWWIPDDEREYIVAPNDEVPFHIPRD